MNIRYVTLSPTGNTTCLVLDPVPPEARPAVTAALMRRCEQVGYLQSPSSPAAAARLEMMGGEFCGNAAMAAAAFLCSEGTDSRSDLLLEVSGTDRIIACRVKPLSDGTYQGSLEMPPVSCVFETAVGGYTAAAVRMEGILHLILTDVSLPDAEAEALLSETAQALPDAAVGLLQWNSKDKRMRPLVHVKESGTMVWETACGSGSVAIGAALALAHGDGLTTAPIWQPGGMILTEAEVRAGQVASVRITGHICVSTIETLHMPD